MLPLYLDTQIFYTSKCSYFRVKIAEICKSKFFLQQAKQVNTVKYSQVFTLDYSQYSQEQGTDFHKPTEKNTKLSSRRKESSTAKHRQPMHLPTVLTVLHTYSKSLFFLSVFIRAGNANAWAALFEIHCMFLVTNSLQDPASGVAIRRYRQWY